MIFKALEYIVIALLLLGSSCKSSKEIRGMDNLYTNTLLQEYRGQSLYIFIKEDTAYYEWRKGEKPSSFLTIDTLIRENTCNCYQGRTYSLHVNSKSIYLKRINESTNAEKGFYFNVATDKQVRQWNTYKNIDKYGSLSLTVYQHLERNSSNRNYYDMVNQEWKSLGRLMGKLDRSEFETKLDSFCLKYLQ